jgi:hypothetical protein
MNKRWLPSLFILGALFFTSAQAEVTVVMMRHAEKPAAGLGQLDCKGLNRALKLGPLLTSRFGKADTVLAPNPAVKITLGTSFWNYVRPLATIEPYAIRNGLPVNTEFGWNDPSSVVNLFLNRQQGLVVVAWEHRMLVEIANQLMQKLGSNQKIPAWPSDDFDTIFVFNIDTSVPAKPTLISFETQQQGLNGQSTRCPQ